MKLLIHMVLSILLLIVVRPLALAQKKSPLDSLGIHPADSLATQTIEASTAKAVSPNYIPPPPNAASLGVFANVPVSLYTGLPSIAVPIYTVKYRDLTLPISLAYHAQGVRVDQEASWVGLGWALNAGGTITRTIRGLDDVLPPTAPRQGYPLLTNDDWPFNGRQLGGGNDPTYNSDAAFSPAQIQGLHDTEPDLFYYNFAGQSGKFVLGQAQNLDGNTKVAKGILLSADKIDISCFLLVNGAAGPRWEIVTADGVKYSFTTKEYTFSRDNHLYAGSQDGTTFIGPTGADAACLNTQSFQGSNASGTYDILYDYDNDLLFTNTHKQIGAWYLDRIESPTGAVINLAYNTTNFASLSPLMRYEEGQPDVNGTSRANGLRLTTSQLITKDKLLKEITFGPQGQGKVSFATEDRTDVSTFRPESSFPSANLVTQGLPQRLRQIQVTYQGSQIIKTFDLQYDYFNAGQATDMQRLKLSGVVENNEKKHFFAYDERQSLPSKNSMDKDHWGYFNGRYDNYNQAGSQVPLLWFQRPQTRNNNSPLYDIIRSFAGGSVSAIRRPDQGVVNAQTNLRDFPFMKAGILNQITYPTGGATRFEYEANSYKPIVITDPNLPFNQDDTDINLKSVSINNGSATVDQAGQAIQSAYFEVKQAGFVKVTRTVVCGSRPCRMWNGNPSTASFASVLPDPASGNTTVLNYNLSADANAYTPPRSGDPNDPTGANFTHFELSSDFWQFLPAGRYRLSVNNIFDAAHNNNKLEVTFSITYPELPPTPDVKIGGGLRIRKMVDTDGTDPTKDIEKTYSYVTTDALPMNSGRLMSNLIQYHYKIIDGDVTINTDQFAERVNYQLRSSPTYPLSTGAQGSAVGYSVVSVVNGKASEGGKITYNYENNPDQLPVIPFIPDYPVSNYNEINGMLRNEYAYEKTGAGYRTLRSSDHSPSSPTLATIQGAKLYNYQIPQTINTILRGKSYSSFAKWNRDNGQTDTDYFYDTDGNLTSTTAITRKYYDNPVHYQMTRMDRESSDGTKVGSLTTYPDDYAGNSGFIGLMKTKNVAYVPIETINYRINANGSVKILKGELTTYRTDCPTCKDQTFLLESASSIDKANFKVSTLLAGLFPGDAGATAQALSPDRTYKPRVKYDSYDANWNVTQYTVDGISTGMSWDASATYPATMVQNVGGSPSLQTNYTIDPLLGVTQKTDPNGMTSTYDYDGLGRLKAVHNAQGDIVKSFAYHYRPVTATSVSQPPSVVNGIADQTAVLGQPFSFAIPAATFAAAPNQSLTYFITGLPGGLSASGLTITGTPTALGSNNITVTVTDGNGASVSAAFGLLVTSGQSGVSVNCAVGDPYTVTGSFASGAPVTISAQTQIITSGTVNVETGATLQLKAPVRVRLLPGFRAKPGAAFNAQIGPCQ